MESLGGREHACLLTSSPASSCSGSDLIGFMCGNVFQSHTCEIPPHLLPISGGHNTQQREESPQPIDSLDRSPTFIAAEKKRLAATQRTLHYPSLFHLVFCSFIYSFLFWTFNLSIYLLFPWTTSCSLYLEIRVPAPVFSPQVQPILFENLPILRVSTINFSHLYCLPIFIKQLLFPTPASQLCELQCLVFR